MKAFGQLRWGALLAMALALPACAGAGDLAKQQAASSLWLIQAKAKSLLGPDLPSTLLSKMLPSIQAAADDASRRRQIDFFRVQAQGVALHMPTPSGQDAWVLGLVGVSRTRTDLSIEATALCSGDGSPASVFSYGGPVAWQSYGKEDSWAGKAIGARKAPSAESWSLMQGLPPSHVLQAYADRMTALAEWLPRRYGAKPFAWDEVPLCFVLEAGDGRPLAFALANHRNRLVLGERKAADVRQLSLVASDGLLLGSATMVGWDDKLADPAASVRFVREEGPRGESIFAWGEAP